MLNKRKGGKMDEKKFLFDVENLKTDFAIEKMPLSDIDINNLKAYSNNQITINEMIEQLKEGEIKL